MSEDFVDVHWRGLEVARKARLRPTADGGGYVEVSAPMPPGTALVIRTADGLELTAAVTAVHEQIGGRSEPPGMQLSVAAAGDAAAWWQARHDAIDAATREAAAQTRTRTIPPVELAQALASAGLAAPVAIVPAAVEPAAVEPAAAVQAAAVQAAATPPASGDEARPTEVMAAVSVDDLTDGDAAAAAIAAEASSDAVPVELADDGRRTMVMNAVDIEAIVAASADATPAEDEPGGASGGDKKKIGRGKRKRGR